MKGGTHHNFASLFFNQLFNRGQPDTCSQGTGTIMDTQRCKEFKNPLLVCNCNSLAVILHFKVIELLLFAKTDIYDGHLLICILKCIL